MWPGFLYVLDCVCIGVVVRRLLTQFPLGVASGSQSMYVPDCVRLMRLCDGSSVLIGVAHGS